MSHRVLWHAAEGRQCLFRQSAACIIDITLMTHVNPAARETTSFHPLAAILAWVLPGLGHIMIGQCVRARRVMIGMAVLILGGLLIGGVDAVDSKNDRLWFAAQAGAGPIVLVIDVVNQTFVGSRPISEAASWRSLGHVNSIGTLSIGLAGLINVVVILDALKPRSVTRRHRRRAEDAPA